MSVPYRPLGLIANCFEACGYTISHTYDDLIFFEHNAFLVQMGEQGKEVLLYFNVESSEGSREELTPPIIAAGAKEGLEIRPAGLYRLESDEGENLQLSFENLE